MMAAALAAAACSSSTPTPAPSPTPAPKATASAPAASSASDAEIRAKVEKLIGTGSPRDVEGDEVVKGAETTTFKDAETGKTLMRVPKDLKA